MKLSSRVGAAVLALILLLSALFSGCAPAAPENSGGISVVTTVFPIYDWVRCLLGQREDVSLTLLQDSGADLHSYQPTVQDMAAIAQCDLFIYVGGPSDGWVAEALTGADNPNLRAVNLLALLDDGDAEGHHEKDHDHGPDEHVWLSLRNAAVLCREIAGALSELDPENRERYGENLQSFTAALTVLDEKYRQTVDAAAHKSLVFGDRFPFSYLAEDYGLDCYAAFSGCSAESEASFETIAYLAGQVDALGLPAVIRLEGAGHRIAETVAETAKAKPKVLVMNAMQSAQPMGADYLTIMEENLAVLTEALG